MVSNDIIDIAYTHTHSNWKRRGFLQKIYTEKEQCLIRDASDPFYMVWRLWSMKESIYKLHMDATSIHKFNPSKISCTVIDEINGIVSIDHQTYNTTTNQTSEYIFTYATFGNLSEVIHKIINIKSRDTDRQSQMCHKALTKDIVHHTGIEATHIHIKKTFNGIPSLFHHKNKMDIDISISHHGAFGAYSILYDG